MNNINEDDQHVLFYIPIGINTRIDYFPGFGKDELKQAMVGIVLGGIASLAVFLFSSLMIWTLITAFTSLAGSILVTTKNNINISVVDYVNFAMKFSKEKKTYPYRQLKEWQ